MTCFVAFHLVFFKASYQPVFVVLKTASSQTLENNPHVINRLFHGSCPVFPSVLQVSESHIKKWMVFGQEALCDCDCMSLRQPFETRAITMVAQIQ